MRAIVFALAIFAAACGQSAAQGDKGAEPVGTAATAAEQSPSSEWVDMILAAVPAAPGPVDPAGVAARVPQVAWRPRPEGGLVAQGVLGNVEAEVLRAPPSFLLRWSATGEPIPYDVIADLRARGAAVALVGCMALGAGESDQHYTVTAPGHAPFGLNVYAREAPTGDASSTYAAIVNLTGRPPTRASLRSDYAPTC